MKTMNRQPVGRKPAIKAYRCPSCGAEIPLKDINVRADTMLCRSCGKIHSCGKAIRRADVNSELRNPPRGVRVVVGICRPDSFCEDRIVYCRRNVTVIMLCLWFSSITGWGAVSSLSHHDWLWGIFLCGLCVLGLAGLVFDLFGRNTLRLLPSEGIYTVGIWGVCKQVKFGIQRDTDARIDEYPNPGLINRGMIVREIVVETGKLSKTRFARSLPRDVQEFFCKCIARRAAGVPLTDMDGGCLGSGIKHPVAFALILAAVALSFAFAFSSKERIVVEDGKLTIEETKWWGRESTISSIPVRDISYVDLKWGRTIEILGNDRRVIRRLQGYGREVSGYQIGLMEAIKSRPGTVFDRSRYTNADFVGVGMFLFIFAAFACGGFDVVPKADKKEA